MVLLDGRQIAQHILQEIKREVAHLPFQPVFCDVLVGDDPVSYSYVKIKGKRAEEAGIEFRLEHLPAEVGQGALIERIHQLNHEPGMCGIIVQLPLPPGFDRQAVLDAIDPALDVDCLGAPATKRFFHGDPVLMPPTAAAVAAIFQQLPEQLRKGRVVIVGKGVLVGRPTQRLLQLQGVPVQLTDNTDPEMLAKVREADVLITGTGQPKLITGSMIKPGAAVIDAGTAESEGVIAGDVDRETVGSVAGFLTPVPGGVGPVTVAELLKNILQVAQNK